MPVPDQRSARRMLKRSTRYLKREQVSELNKHFQTLMLEPDRSKYAPLQNSIPPSWNMIPEGVDPEVMRELSDALQGYNASKEYEF